MKILFCSSTYQVDTHGPSKFAKLILQINDIYANHEIRILTPDIDIGRKNLIYKLKEIKWPRYIGVLWLHFDNFIFYQKVKKIREEYEFDVLIYNNMAQALWSRLMLPKPIKVGGFVHDYEYVRRSRFKPELNKQWVIDMFRKPLEKLACRYCDFVITNSHYVKNMIVKKYKCKEERVQMLYQSVDFSAIKLKSRMIFSNRISVLFVKYDFMIGGLFVLMEALGLLSNLCFNLLVVGPVKKDHSWIFSKCQSYSNVECHLLGSLPQKDVFSIMQSSDIFCVPSFREGLGIANMEALYTGIPVVSSDAGGIPEVLDFGNNGWLSEAGSPHSLAKAIKDCISNEEERAKKIKNGRAYVNENFDHKKMLAKFVAMLEEIVQ